MKIADLPEKSTPAGGETVLILDDGVAKRTTVAALLEANPGFVAVAADLTGPDTIGQAVANADNINLVVDNMPAVQRAPQAAVEAASSAASARDLVQSASPSLAAIAMNRLDTVLARIALLENVAAASAVPWILSATIDPEGWTMSIVMGSARTGGVIDPTKLSLKVVSMGFDRGLPAVRERTLKITAIKRKPYPNHASKEDSVSGGLCTIICTLGSAEGGAGFVFAKDKDGGVGTSRKNPILLLSTGWITVGGNPSPGQAVEVNNTSTRPYPTPLCLPNVPPFLLSTTTARMEVIGCGEGAQDFRTFESVQFSATGRTSGVTTTPQLVSAITKSTFRTAKISPSLCFGCDHDVSALTQGETADWRFIAYPFIGDNPVDSAAYSFPQAGPYPCNYPIEIDKTGAYPKLYASWSLATGNDTTGAVATSEATAEATPFATFQRAMYALHTAGTTASATGKVQLHVVAKEAGSYALNFKNTDANIPSVVMTDTDWTLPLKTWAFVRPKSGVSGIELTTVSSAGNSRLPSLFCNQIKGHTTATSSASILINGGETTTSLGVKHFWWDADLTGAGDTTIPAFSGFSYEYVSNVTGATPGRLIKPQGNQANNLKLVRDVQLDVHSGNGSAQVINGWYAAQCLNPVMDEIADTSGAAHCDGYILCNVVGMRCSVQMITHTEIRTRGFVWLNVLAEAQQLVTPLIGINNDGNVKPTHNHYIWNLGSYGARMNYEYEDAATMVGTGQLKDGNAFCNSILYQYYNKSDWFANNGANIHNQATRHHVQFSSNTFLVGSYANPTLGPNNELGELLGDNEVYLNLSQAAAEAGTMQYMGVNLFANWKATAAQGGLSDFTPQHATLMGVSRQAVPFDAFGAARDTKLMTAARGPIEHT
ncbi:hypothetical protein BH11PSE6_BH11PSE6_14240 [soil metagenome]